MAKPSNFSYRKPRDLKHTLKRIAPYIAHSRKELIFACIFAVMGGGIMTCGTYALRAIINGFILRSDIEGLKQAILLMAFCYMIGVLCTFLHPRLGASAAQKVAYEIRTDLFEHLEKLPLSYFDTHASGDIMSCFTNDIENITEAVNNSLAALVQNFVMLVLTLVFLFVMNWKLSLIVVGCQTFTTILVRYNTVKSRVYYREQQKYIGSMNGFLEEMIAGQKVVKVFNHETENMAEFDHRNDELRDIATQAAIHTGIMTPIATSMGYANYALSAVGGGLFTLSGLMDLGTLTSYMVLVRQSAMPFNHLTQQINFLLSALSGAERIFEMMDETPEADEGTVELRRTEDGFFWHDTRTDQEVPLRGDIRFTDRKSVV